MRITTQSTLLADALPFPLGIAVDLSALVEAFYAARRAAGDEQCPEDDAAENLYTSPA